MELAQVLALLLMKEDLKEDQLVIIAIILVKELLLFIGMEPAQHAVVH